MPRLESHGWPGTLSETVTEHYRRAHPEALSLPPQ